ncbi:acyltransferase family protein [Glaciihabitans sp. UYNi722]|uniref:acyltransferase family protein n=1 Tax=Glaciihabitans sp. UYNi722 TaxID=3156344 RepID=UPI00339B6FBD
MSETRSRHRERTAQTKPTHFLPHVQGLRAIAVILVVLYHFWPGRLSGGYIGVDIFFVISGFLITGQLAREIERTGRIALPSFWGKRVRRLLPASITVLIFSTLATFFILPLSSLVDSLREILASTFYFENWSLAASSVNYLASHDATAVQHYWSLSLEEQFYIFWPLLLLAATWLGVRFFGRRRWLAMVVLVVLVSLISLVASVLYTHNNPAEAFFVTFTRVWEFGAGAILALLPRFRPRGAWWPNIIGYAGLVAILVSAYKFGPNTQFPGYAALVPVLGAAAILVSSRAEHWWDIGSVLGGRPQRFIGDISYSVYLWHWPLIIIAPYIPGWGLDGINRIALLLASFVLGWLTKRYIEDPARTWKFFTTRKPRFTYGFMIALMLVSTLFVAGAFAINNPKYQAAAAELQKISANPPECFGAEQTADCSNPKLAGKVIPDAGFGNADKPGNNDCFVQLNESAVKACHFGSTSPNAPKVALIGDSHAYQYIETMKKLAAKNGWSLTTYLKGACPWNTTPIGGPSVAFTDSCQQWLVNLKAELGKQPAYGAIFVTALHATPYVTTATTSAEKTAEIAAGFSKAWTQAKGAPIVALVDNPDFLTDPNKCLRLSSPKDCTEKRADVLSKTDPIGVAAKDSGATLLDFTDKYCDTTDCFSVVGGANVYRDQDHLTVTWTLTLANLIGKAITSALPAH